MRGHLWWGQSTRSPLHPTPISGELSTWIRAVRSLDGCLDRNCRPSPFPQATALSCNFWCNMAHYLQIPIHAIIPSPHQPRKQFTPAELVELADSIRAVGLIQPIVVRQRSDSTFELIAGERRWRASQLAGLEKIPAVVSDAAEQRCALMALIENIQRADLNPMEEAEAYQKLQREFHLTQEDLAHRVGKKRSTVANVLRLFSLPPDLQRALRDQKMTLGHAKALLALPTAEAQRSVFRRIEAEGLSVRQVEALAQHASSTIKKTSPPLDADLQAFLRALETHLGAEVRWDGDWLQIRTLDTEDLTRIAETLGVAVGS